MPFYLRAINRENWPEPEDKANIIASIIIKSICAGQDYIIDQGQIKELFAEVVKEGKLCSSDIDKSRHRKLQRLIIQIEKEME